MALRDLLLRLSVIDESSEKLAAVMEKVHELEHKTIEIKTKVASTVAPQLQQIQRAEYQTVQATRSLESAYVDAEKAGFKVAAAQSTVAAASQEVAQKTKEVKTAIEDTSKSAGLISNIKEAWKDTKKEITELTVLTGALTMSSVYAVDKVEESLRVITNLRGSEAAESWKAWMEEAKQTSAVARASIAQSTALFLKQVTSEDQKKLATYLEKESLREGKSPEEIASIIEGIGKGRGSQVIKSLPGISIDFDSITKQVEDLQNNPVWKQQNKDISAVDLQAKLLTEAIINYAETVKDVNGKTLQEWEGEAGSLERIRFAMQRIGYTLGESVFPYFEQAIIYLEDFNNVLSDNKASAGIAMIAISAVFAIGTLTLMFAKVAEGLILFAKVTRLAALAQWALNIAMTMNPIGLLVLGLVALITILGVVAYKMGWLDGLIKKIGETPLGALWGSELGILQDIINALMGDTDALQKRLDGLKEWLGTSQGQKVALAFAMTALGPLGAAFSLAGKLYEQTKGGTKTLEIMQNYFETLLKILVAPLAGILWLVDLLRDIWGGMGDLYNQIITALNDLPAKLKAFLTGQDEESQRKKALAADYGLTHWTSMPNSDEKGIGMRNYVINAASKPPAGLPHDLRGVDWYNFQKEHPDLVKHYSPATEGVYKPETLLAMGIPPEALAAMGAAPEVPTSYVPEEGNPFYNPEMTNEIAGPGEIKVLTKPAEDVKGSADVEGGLQILGRMGYDKAKQTWDSWTGPKAAEGITARGPTWVLMGEAGTEETVPPGQTEKGPGAIARGIDLLQDILPRSGVPAGTGAESSAGPAVIVQGDLIRVDKIERSADIDDIIWRARTRLEELVPRQAGSYRGGN